MIQCPYCERSLSSEGSYRVHKHRFHKGLEYRQPVAMQEEAQQPTPEPVEAEHESFVHETPEPSQEQSKPQEPEHRGRGEVTRNNEDDGLGKLLAISGAVAGIILLLLFGKKQ